MISEPVPNRDDAALAEWVDAVADRFEAAWQTVTPPRLDDFVASAAEERRAALLAELVPIDRAYRRLVATAEAPPVNAPPPDAIRQPGTDTMRDGQTPGSAAAETRVDRPLWPTLPGYEILAELGHGGMGVVYKARHLRLNRLVALKVLRSGYAEQDRRQRFRVEVEAVARLQHPHIVQIYEVGEYDGRPYCALEYVHGGSLAQQLDGTPQPARSAAELLELLARAVHHAHQHDVVHRDLKPANILLQGDWPQKGTKDTKEDKEDKEETGLGRVPLSSSSFASFVPFCGQSFLPKIADFGLAKLLEGEASQTQSGEVMGTPSYMAPEQAEGKNREIEPRTDVYSLGAILYELLTGRPPFKGDSVLATLDQVRSPLAPVPPRRLQPKLPRDLDTICLKALAKVPARRYASALDLADDLRRFLDGKPIKARPVGRAERLWRWCKRNPVVAGSAAILSALLLGWTITIVYLSGIIADRTRVVGTRETELATASQQLESATQQADARQKELDKIDQQLETATRKADARAKELESSARLPEMQMIRLSPRENGWSKKAFGLGEEAARLHKDRRVQSQVAATLAGLDASVVAHFDTFGASSVAFDRDGNQLVMENLFPEAISRRPTLGYHSRPRFERL